MYKPRHRVTGDLACAHCGTRRGRSDLRPAPMVPSRHALTRPLSLSCIDTRACQVRVLAALHRRGRALSSSVS